MIVYLAGPRFGLAERKLSEEFAKTLERCYMPLQVILPLDREAEFGTALDFVERTYRFALDAVNQSDAVVAILDGADADSGTCIEMGYAAGKGKLVIGVRTDFRAGADHGLNPMVSGACDVLIARNSRTTALDDVAEEIADVFARHERQVAAGSVSTHCQSRSLAAS